MPGVPLPTLGLPGFRTWFSAFRCSIRFPHPAKADGQPESSSQRNPVSRQGSCPWLPASRRRQIWPCHMRWCTYMRIFRLFSDMSEASFRSVMSLDTTYNHTVMLGLNLRSGGAHTPEFTHAQRWARNDFMKIAFFLMMQLQSNETVIDIKKSQLLKARL